MLLNRVIINGTLQNDFDREIISITTDGTVTDDYGASTDSKKNITEDSIRENMQEIVTEVVGVSKPTTESPGGFFDGIFGFLFKDDPPEEKEITTPNSMTHFKLPELDYESMKVPEFKNLSKEVEIPAILLNNATVDHKESPNENVTVIRDILIDLLDNGAEEKETEKIPTTSEAPTKIHNRLSVSHLTPTLQLNPIRSSLDLVIPHRNDNENYNPDSYQILPEDSSISNTESFVVNPVDVSQLKQHQSEGETQIFTKPIISSAQDPVGLLKLAGCNIYGRMYRVGRIISELSGPCLECKCTEVGVHCTPLDC